MIPAQPDYFIDIVRTLNENGALTIGYVRVRYDGLALASVASGAPLSSDRAPWLCHEDGGLVGWRAPSRLPRARVNATA